MAAEVGATGADVNKVTDRELLEAAAKAAGYWCAEFNCPDRVPVNWNPLEDDGDALRLAVRLSIEVRPYLLSGVTCAGHVLRPHQRIEELHSGGSMAATRRAIVRAVAALTEE